MAALRENLLSTYEWLTLPKRRAMAEQFALAQSWPAGVVFYHRVADSVPNPWTISNDNFIQHLDLMSKLATFASLEETIQSQRQGTRNKLSIAITFDDGYAENLDRAIPELIRRKIPCTYFATTDHIANQKHFEHDEKRGQPLCVNSISEIRWMAKNGIQIGGHTASHLDLGKPWSRERLVAEISDSRKKLQDWTGQEIAHFAFPYGLPRNISQAAIDVVYESGYQAFVSAYGGLNFPGGDSFHIGRFHGECGTASLHNWLTLDPRKVARASPLVYQKPTTPREVDSANFSESETLNPADSFANGWPLNPPLNPTVSIPPMIGSI
jgi:peptidoglycan/xylan/chitin deacetylase (PgdA/CDA1 family)